MKKANVIVYSLIAVGVILIVLSILKENKKWPFMAADNGATNPNTRFGGVIFPDSKCQCYCSDKCGPRDIKYGIDRPFVDNETGICFCADRDKRNFVSNGCNRKSVQSFANSCCA